MGSIQPELMTNHGLRKAIASIRARCGVSDFAERSKISLEAVISMIFLRESPVG
jgi:hypothetical protein